MNFLGEEAISRETRVTGRATLIASLTVLLVEMGWVELTDASVLGLRFAEDAFGKAAALILPILIVAHLVQWWGDFLSYRSWNIEGRKAADARLGYTDIKLLDPFSDIGSGIDAVEEESFTSARTAFDRAADAFRDLNVPVKRHARFARFYVCGWHFALPLIAATVAIATALDLISLQP